MPLQHQKTVVQSVEKWNTSLQEWGILPQGQKVFIPVVQELEHLFDLRYPSIIWIDDKRISTKSPLGVGMAHADVRNGKILWGSVVLYGGLLEQYINAYAPIETGSPAKANKMYPIAQGTPIIPQSFEIPTGFKNIDISMRAEFLSQMTNEHRQFLSQEINRVVFYSKYVA